MIANMPQYSQTPVRSYLETGNYPGHTKSAIPADEAKEQAAEILSQTEVFIAADNTPDDLDPRPGIIATTDPFFGAVHMEYKKEEDGSLETFFTLGDDQLGAVVYTRNSPESLDVITVSTENGPDDGATHINHLDPAQSFITFAG